MKKSQADEINEVIKVSLKKIKKLNSENAKLSIKCDSLVSLLKKKPICLEIDTLKDIRSRLKKLSSNGVLIYSFGNNGSVNYVDLSEYKIIFYANEMVKMIPLKSKIKVKLNSIGTDDLPNPDNLSLHFLPHNLKGNKFDY